MKNTEYTAPPIKNTPITEPKISDVMFVSAALPAASKVLAFSTKT